MAVAVVVDEVALTTNPVLVVKTSKISSRCKKFIMFSLAYTAVARALTLYILSMNANLAVSAADIEAATQDVSSRKAPVVDVIKI